MSTTRKFLPKGRCQSIDVDYQEWKNTHTKTLLLQFFSTTGRHYSGCSYERPGLTDTFCNVQYACIAAVVNRSVYLHTRFLLLQNSNNAKETCQTEAHVQKYFTLSLCTRRTTASIVVVDVMRPCMENMPTRRLFCTLRHDSQLHNRRISETWQILAFWSCNLHWNNTTTDTTSKEIYQIP